MFKSTLLKATEAGANELKRLHPKPHRLKSILGLDAKNPAIILADADLDNAVSESLLGLGDG